MRVDGEIEEKSNVRREGDIKSIKKAEWVIEWLEGKKETLRYKKQQKEIGWEV